MADMIDPQIIQQIAALYSPLQGQNIWQQLGNVLQSQSPRQALRQDAINTGVNTIKQQFGFGLEPGWKTFAQQQSVPYSSLYPMQNAGIDPSKFDTMWVTQPDTAQAVMQQAKGGQPASFLQGLFQALGGGS